MALPSDNSYQITGKVCPPRLPMHSLATNNQLSTSHAEALFTEIPVKGKNVTSSLSACALTSQASVLLHCDDSSHSSVVSIPYFFCNFCDKHTDSKTVLLQHLARKHIFQCESCDFVTFTRYNLIQHQLQKHLDAREMQSNLTTKALAINTSQLQRVLAHIHEPPEYSNHPVISGNGVDISEIDQERNFSPEDISSRTHRNESVEDHILGQNVSNVYDFSNRTRISLRTSTDSESSVSSSKGRISPPSQSCSSKSCSNVEQSSASETPGKDGTPKWLKTNPSKQSKQQADGQTDELHSSCRMPHFLDETDVSSSCTPERKKSMEQCSRIMSKQPQRRSTLRDESLSSEMPSFLTEPLISPESVKCLNLETNSGEGMHKSRNSYSVMKLLQWYDKESSEHIHGNDQPEKPDIISDFIALPSSSVESRILEPVQERSPGSPFDATKRSSSPNLSVLSGEKLQKQLEEAVSKSPGFLFMDSGRKSPGSSLDHETDKHSVSGQISSTNQLQTTKNDRVSSPNVSYTDCHRIHNESRKNRFFQEKENGFEHFLNTPGTTDNATKGKAMGEEKMNRKPDFVEIGKGADCSEGERYDILRKLLVCKSGDKSVASKSKVNENDEVQIKGFSSTGLSSVASSQSQARNDNDDKGLQSIFVTRPSDMSLKELLAQKLPVPPPEPTPVSPAVCLVCGYCNFETSSKHRFHEHVKFCKYSKLEEKYKHSPSHGNETFDRSTAHLSDDDDISVVKVESVEYNQQENSMKSFGNFSASGMLKGLSDHYSVSTRSRRDNMFLDSLCGSSNRHADNVLNQSRQNSKIRKTLSKSDGTSQSLIQKTEVENLSESEVQQSVVVRTKRKNDDADYVCESDDTSGSSDSESGSWKVPSSKSKRRCIKKAKQNVEGQRDLCRSEHQASKRWSRNICKYQPDIDLSCLNCSFSTHDRAIMRQHLIEIHPDSLTFAQAHFKGRGKTMLYFCKGVTSTCTFLSSEGAEIFQHVKLCYAGHLDSFINDGTKEATDFSQVLLSLGMASKLIDPSSTSFHCLRCKFSKADYQRMANHVASNHSNSVAGVLLVSKTSTDLTVEMACLACNSMISAKEWFSHSCRKQSRATPAGKSLNERVLSLSKLSSDVVKLHQMNMASENSPDEAHREDPTYLETKSLCKTPELSSVKNEPVYDSDIPIKQEITEADDTLQETASNSCVQWPQPEMDEDKDKKQQKKIKHMPNDQTLLVGTSANVVNKKTIPGPSVLQNLLTAPKEVVLVPKGFSLLENLLKPPSTEEGTGIKNNMLVLGRSQETSSVTSPSASATRTQHSRMMELLSRPHATTQAPTLLAKPPCRNRSPPIDPQNNEKDKKPGFVGNRMGSTSSSESIASKALRAAVLSNQCSPSQRSTQSQSQITISVPDTSDLTPEDPSPPMIPHPPQLPLLPPLSPSPPPSAAGEGPSTPGPFTNLLLGLLSKADNKSGTQ